MHDSPLEKLENLIPTLVEETRRLREENALLLEERDRLQNQLTSQDDLSKQLGQERQKRVQLETRHKQFEQDKTEIRSRVKGILGELKNFDFI